MCLHQVLERGAAESFLGALALRDFDQLAASLARTARARMLLPRGAEELAGRDQIARRLDGRSRELIEQVAFVDPGPEGIQRMDLLCSGFLPDTADQERINPY
jgi:hypothetical protein